MNAHHNRGPACLQGSSCKWDHSKVLSRAEFDAMTKPGKPKNAGGGARSNSRNGNRPGTPRQGSRSASRKPGGNPNRDYYWSDGKALPKFCISFANGGKCDFEKKNPGQRCNFPHRSQEANEKRAKDLLANPPPKDPPKGKGNGKSKGKSRGRSQSKGKGKGKGKDRR